MKTRSGRDEDGAKYFLAAARLLLQLWPRLEKERLVQIARLAVLRRALLELLAERIPHLPAEPAQRLALAREAGCPLLANGLDGLTQADADAAVLALENAPPAADLAELYQHLVEVDIAVRGKKRPTLALAAGRSKRRQEGLFFTPGWLADRLAGWVVAGGKANEMVLLDPACGAGSLLQAAARLLVDREGGGEEARAFCLRRLVQGSMRGVEVNPLVAALCRTGFWLLADPGKGPVAGLQEMVAVGDAVGGPLVGGGVDWQGLLPRQWAEKDGFDAIVANPPFEVLTRFARRPELAEYVRRVRQAGYRFALKGSLRTERLFLERCLQLLRPGGRLAIVMPASFLTDRTASALRGWLLEQDWLRRVEVFDESGRVFGGVNQAVCWLGIEKRSGGGRLSLVCGGEGEQELKLDWLKQLDRQDPVVPSASAEMVGLAVKMKKASTASFSQVADGWVGEVDQTFFRRFMLDRPGKALLVRGEHLSPYRLDLSTERQKERWLDEEGFAQAKGGGAWREHVLGRRVVQTGIVNLEARRRMVAALAPAGVYLGNSVNYWIPSRELDWPEEIRLGYLLGLLNSLPYEWCFRLTSSNNNVNLYEVKSLPLPRLTATYPAESIEAFLQRAEELVKQSRGSVLGTVRQITAGWDVPSREDRAAAMLIGKLAWRRLELREAGECEWLEQVLHHLVNWHLGMDEPDLENMAAWLHKRFGKKGGRT